MGIGESSGKARLGNVRSLSERKIKEEGKEVYGIVERELKGLETMRANRSESHPLTADQVKRGERVERTLEFPILASQGEPESINEQSNRNNSHD